jgi:hypothetical protein
MILIADSGHCALNAQNALCFAISSFDQLELRSSSLDLVPECMQLLAIDRLPVVQACKLPSRIAPLCPTFLRAEPPLNLYLLLPETTTLLDGKPLGKRVGPWP